MLHYAFIGDSIGDAVGNPDRYLEMLSTRITRNPVKFFRCIFNPNFAPVPRDSRNTCRGLAVITELARAYGIFIEAATRGYDVDTTLLTATKDEDAPPCSK